MDVKNRVDIKVIKTRWNTLEVYNGQKYIGEIDKDKLLKFLSNDIQDIESFSKIG